MKAKFLQKNSRFCYLFILFLSVSIASVSQTVSLEKVWETPAILKEPESVLYDRINKVFYVSNINNPAADKDGNGSVGRISLTGKIQDVEWVTGGMDSPKGLGLSKGLLYVADLTKIVVIDIKTGKVIRNIEVQDAGMLNDITVNAQGEVFVSDSDKKKIYKINARNEAEVWLEKDFFQKLNGVLAHDNKFYTVDMNAGIFYEVDKNTKALRKIADNLIGGDGIVAIGKDFIVSNWNGEINHVSAAGKVTKLLDTKNDKVNAADIEYIPSLKLLLVPTFFANKVVAYKVTLRD